MYGKHFASTYTGSMLGAGADVFAVWGYVIAHTVNSAVELNPNLLAFILGMELKNVEIAIEYLCRPDAKSRNKAQEGRRLVRTGEYLYEVITHSIYRKIQNPDEKREADRNRQRKHREEESQLSHDVTNVTNVAHTDTDTDTDTEALKTKPTVASLPDWIPIEAWQGFVEMRKKIRAPLTDRATRLTISKLETLKSEGHEPGAVLDQSTQNDWRGVFPLRVGGNGKAWTHNENPKPGTENLSDFFKKQLAQDGVSVPNLRKPNGTL